MTPTRPLTNIPEVQEGLARHELRVVGRRRMWISAPPTRWKRVSAKAQRILLIAELMRSGNVSAREMAERLRVSERHLRTLVRESLRLAPRRGRHK